MSDKSVDSWRARAAVSEALDVFNSSYMQEVWTKALARRPAIKISPRPSERRGCLRRLRYPAFVCVGWRAP